MINLTATAPMSSWSRATWNRLGRRAPMVAERGSMKGLSWRDWALVAVITFVASGAFFIIFYWLYRSGW